MSNTGDQISRQDIAINIDVIRNYSGSANRQRQSLCNSIAIIYSHRGVINRGDGQYNGGEIIAVRLPITGAIRKAVAAVVVGHRCVSEAPGVQCQCAVSSARYEYYAESVAVH